MEKLPTSFPPLMALQICAFVKTLEKVRRRHVCLSYLGRLPWNRHFRMSCQMVSRIPCKVLTGCRMSSSTSPPSCVVTVRHLHEYFFFLFLSSPILHDKLSKRVRNENKRPGFWPLACGRHFFFLPPSRYIPSFLPPLWPSRLPCHRNGSKRK